MEEQLTLTPCPLSLLQRGGSGNTLALQGEGAVRLPFSHLVACQRGSSKSPSDKDRNAVTQNSTLQRNGRPPVPLFPFDAVCIREKGSGRGPVLCLGEERTRRRTPLSLRDGLCAEGSWHGLAATPVPQRVSAADHELGGIFSLGLMIQLPFGPNAAQNFIDHSCKDGNAWLD